MIKLKLVSLPVKPRYYGGKFKAAPKWLVVHYTGTPGSSALSEARYLTKTLTKKGTHFIVDDATIYRSTPESRIAWHCGSGQCANPEQKTLEELSEMHASDWRYDLAAKNHLRWLSEGEDFTGNAVSIGVDLCCQKASVRTKSAKDTDWSVTNATTQNAANLVAWLMQKYNIPTWRVIRHADCTGKPCPRPFVSLPGDKNSKNDFLWSRFVWSVDKLSRTEAFDVWEVIHADA